MRLVRPVAKASIQVDAVTRDKKKQALEEMIRRAAENLNLSEEEARAHINEQFRKLKGE